MIAPTYPRPRGDLYLIIAEALEKAYKTFDNPAKLNQDEWLEILSSCDK